MVWLSSELMFFAGLFAIYFQLRSVSAPLWAEQTAKLNITFASINTAILVISSVWCQIGVMKAERGQAARTGKLTEIGKWGMREWYVVTYLFGATFIAGQVLEYAKLVSENVTLSSDRYGSVFYMATGFHGLHVTGGLIAFLLIIGRTFTTPRYTHHPAVGAVLTTYHWHLVHFLRMPVVPATHLIQ